MFITSLPIGNSKIFPSKHDALKQYYFNIVPASKTLGQRLHNIVSVYRVVFGGLRLSLAIENVNH